MKTLLTTLTLSLALCGAVGVSAQSKNTMDTQKLLSETVDGNYLVRRYVVTSPADNDYSIRYQISMAKLMPALDGNKSALADIDAFMAHVMKDTLLNVSWIGITGYASPDGPMAANETLAKNRTMDFMAYADQKYGLSKHFKVKTAWVADDWSAARPMIAQSGIPNKADALKVIDGTGSHMEKEAQLKRMTGVWDYLKMNILPPMRRVDLVIYYGAGNIVEHRMLIPQPEVVIVEEPCCVVVDEAITGMIVENPYSETDFKKITCKERKELRQMEKVAKQDAKQDAKIMKKLLKKEAKAAKELAKEEAKAAKKAMKEMGRL